ncbi:MAG: NAD(P)H-binding protein [Chromatiales bacterium]|nr:MAG: NAD(P)H-binding protein [Chromatiales bacterium]
MKRGLMVFAGVFAFAVATADESNRALVFGGTGRLGAPIVELLVEAGYPVTIFARPTSNRERLAGLDVDYVTGDLLEGDSVTAAVNEQPFRFVIDASGRGRSTERFYDTAMRNILVAIADSDVQQFILHGSVGAGDNVKNFPDIPFGRMMDTLNAKGEAEDLLKASGITYTIIRNGRVLPYGTPATGTGELTEDDTVMANITRLDLASLTLQCLDNPDCFNKTFHAQDPGLEAYSR